MSLTEEQEKQAIREATREAMHDVLLAMGINASDKEAVIEMQKDMAWVRGGRQASENMPKYFRRTGIGAITTLAIYVAWAWLAPVVNSVIESVWHK